VTDVISSWYHTAKCASQYTTFCGRSDVPTCYIDTTARRSPRQHPLPPSLPHARSSIPTNPQHPPDTLRLPPPVIRQRQSHDAIVMIPSRGVIRDAA